MSEWISVKERLPDSMKPVLVYTFWHGAWCIRYGRYEKSDDQWYVVNWLGEWPGGDVTHWMPLPEPPKED